MKLNRRSFLGRVAAACGLSALVRVEPPLVAQVPFVTRSAITDAALRQMMRDMEIVFRSESTSPLGKSPEELLRTADRLLA